MATSCPRLDNLTEPMEKILKVRHNYETVDWFRNFYNFTPTYSILWLKVVINVQDSGL